MNYYVYVLRSRQDEGYYIGISRNPWRRLREHNQGKTKSLRHRRPLELIYWEKTPSIQTAREREKQLKSFKGGDALQQLLTRRGAGAVERGRLESG